MSVTSFHEPLKLFNAAQGEPSIFCKSWDFATKRGGGHKKVHFFNKKNNMLKIA